MIVANNSVDRVLIRRHSARGGRSSQPISESEHVGVVVRDMEVKSRTM